MLSSVFVSLANVASSLVRKTCSCVTSFSSSLISLHQSDGLDGLFFRLACGQLLIEAVLWRDEIADVVSTSHVWQLLLSILSVLARHKLACVAFFALAMGYIASTIDRTVGDAGRTLAWREGILDHSECRICFSELERDEAVKVLACHHVFHVACIDRWYRESQTCPVCRHRIARPPPPYQRPVRWIRVPLAKPASGRDCYLDVAPPHLTTLEVLWNVFVFVFDALPSLLQELVWNPIFFFPSFLQTFPTHPHFFFFSIHPAFVQDLICSPVFVVYSLLPSWLQDLWWDPASFVYLYLCSSAIHPFIPPPLRSPRPTLHPHFRPPPPPLPRPFPRPVAPW